MMTAFMEKGEPQSACSVIRDLFAGQIEKIIAESGRLLSQERAAESIASDITVIVKGLSYEFYTQGKEYDLVGETERILRMVIPTLLLKTLILNTTNNLENIFFFDLLQLFCG